MYVYAKGFGPKRAYGNAILWNNMYMTSRKSRNPYKKARVIIINLLTSVRNGSNLAKVQLGTYPEYMEIYFEYNIGAVLHHHAWPWGAPMHFSAVTTF